MSRFEKLFSFALLILFGAVAALFIFNLQLNNVKKFQTLVGDSKDINQINSQTALTEATSSANIEILNQQISHLEASSSALLERIEKLEIEVGTGSASETKSGTTTRTRTSNIATAFQKQIFYLGSANTTSLSWTDSDVEIKLNSEDYPSDVNAFFEVGISIVGGEAWARLINKSTGAIMAITEVSHSTSTTTWKTSPAFKLFTGNNTYALQIRSSSGETANFSGARIVIDR